MIVENKIVKSLNRYIVESVSYVTIQQFNESRFAA